MSISTLKIFPALMVAITAGWATQPVLGGAIHQISITENSSTSLTATYDGSPLTVNFDPGFPDQWLILLPQTFTLGVDEEQWTEPENSGLANLLAFNPPIRGIPPSIGVISDMSLDSQIPVNADGATVQVGTDGGVAVFAHFTDQAAGSEGVPDTGTTCSLLALSLMGLAFFRRKLC